MTHDVQTDDFSKLTEVDNYWGWLPDEPARAVRETVAGLLADQVEGATLEWMQVTAKPAFVTGGPRHPENADRIILARTAVAVPFTLSVRTPDGTRDTLWGVFTWAACGLDQQIEQRRDRVWLDLESQIEWAKERLKERVHEVEAM